MRDSLTPGRKYVFGTFSLFPSFHTSSLTSLLLCYTEAFVCVGVCMGLCVFTTILSTVVFLSLSFPVSHSLSAFPSTCCYGNYKFTH